ncbi:hypothetical protein BH10ACI3_BH10ACI3_28130 [soil metagenome]
MSRSPVQSSHILVHTIFSTKGQSPLITPEIEPLLYDRISKILFDRCYSPALAIGGEKEHIHILFALARNWSPDAIINMVRDKSAEFIRKWSPNFGWQETYAAFTESRSEDEIIIDYIHRQKEIHKSLYYKDEFRQLLERNGIEYDENDLWD